MMRAAAALAASLLGAAAFAAPAVAQMGGDPMRGRALATRCVACHGLDGSAQLPDAPHIAGQSQIYLIKALNDYRGGARRDERMSIMAQQMNDQDVLDLSAYFSSIRIEIVPPN